MKTARPLLRKADTNGFVFLKEVDEDFKLEEGAILVQGLPGMGMVGKISVDFLAEELGAREVTRIYSSFSPPVVRLDSQGIGRLARLEILATDSVKPNILFLTGDFQPADLGIILVLSKIVELAVEKGVGTAVALGGLRAPNGPEVASFVYDQEMSDWLEGHDIPLLRGGEVSGAVGVLTALAYEEGIKSYGLLGKLSMGGGADPIASKNVMMTFSRLYNIDIDLDRLEKRIEETKKIAESLQQQVQTISDEGRGEDDSPSSFYI